MPESWARFCSLIRARPGHQLAKNELLDIYYNGLTVESRTYLDSCAGCVFRKRTLDEAEELMAKISQNYDDWSIPEPAPTPTPTPKKRGIIELSAESMRETKKSLKERGLKSEDVKYLPPIEELCKPLPRSSVIEVHSLFNFKQVEGEKMPQTWARFCSLLRARPGHKFPKNELPDIYYNGLTVESRTYLDRISQNYDVWSIPDPTPISTPTPTPKKRGIIEFNDESMREAKKSLKERGIKSEDVRSEERRVGKECRL